MLTRRKLIKLLLGTGAGLIVWPFLPDKISETISAEALSPLVGESQSQAPMHLKIGTSAMDDVQALTGGIMQGREAGSAGEVGAAEYLTNQLRALGIKPAGEIGYEQVFTVPALAKNFVRGRLVYVASDKKGLRTPCINILGQITGHKDDVIVLSAHYDHLGIYEGRVYSGANDNASGVGCILDVLRRIVKEGAPLNSTLVIAFWSAEEMGFVGSSSFIEHPTLPLDRIKAVLNVDTVGNGTNGNFAYWADGSNKAVEAVRQASTACGAPVVPAPSNGHSSDHISFAKNGIPAVTLIAREWLERNHTVNDTVEFVKPEQVHLASEIIYRALKILD